LQNLPNRFPLFGGQIGKIVLRDCEHFGRVNNQIQHVPESKSTRRGHYVISVFVNEQNYVAVFVNNNAVVKVRGGDLQDGIIVKNRVISNADARHSSR